MQNKNKRFCRKCGHRLYLSKETGYYEVKCPGCGRLCKGNK